MRIRSFGILIAILIIVFGGIYSFKGLGLWQTESTKEPQKFESGLFEGQPMPDDIRGSYSFGDIEAAYGVQAATLAKAFNMDSNQPKDIKAKDLESVYDELEEGVEIGTGSVKLFVSLYTGLPYEGDDYILDTAVTILKADGKWSDLLEAELSGRILTLREAQKSEVISSSAEAEDSATDESDHEEEIGIKGKTTVNDAIAYGISKEVIEEILGIEVENDNMLIRDLCEQNEISFSVVKEQLNTLLETTLK
jgi:hypothetical protein